MTFETIEVQRPAEHVARVVLRRPEAANALNATMLDELSAAVDLIEADDDIRVWILTGGPRSDGRPCFSAGVDMKEALGGAAPSRVDPAELVDRIDDLLKPSLAVIAGVCTTGALELVLACDLRITARSARLSDWHLKRSGLGIGAWGLAARLSRLVGVDKAKELVLLSAEIDGDEAARIGLVNRAVEDDQLEAVALEMATTIASYPRRGVRTTLGYLQLQAEMSKRDAIRWAGLTPGFMGVTLRPFEDAAARFFDQRQPEEGP
ncbi:MAG: 3-hydroxyacyl-CoA dehydrogenase [Frankiales bacterium]|nr:3-hydroxyacyl-CoA dehydrogenase [Frankiales bacterium]